MKLATAAQMQAMDKQAMEEYGVPSLVLMENAALRVVDILAARLGPLRGRRVAVVCGKGNNGGDGLAVARHLHTRFGAHVAAHLIADPDTLIGDAAVQFRMAQKFGVPLHTENMDFGHADVIVDALLGTGVRGPVEGAFAFAIDAINGANCPVVAVDVPSGLNADTGEVSGPCVRAMLTVTFALPKFGLAVFPGAEYVGELIAADIGFPRAVQNAPDIHAFMTDAADIRRWLPARTEAQNNNKGTYGHTVIFAGSRGMAGASALCADAAARTGAGLVTLLVPQDAQNTVVSIVSPVVMTRGLPQTSAGTFALSALEAALEMAQKSTAAAVGPGIGGGTDNPETAQFVREFVQQCPVPLVIDADALNILSREPGHGATIVRARSAPTVLTPHPGEMGRLLGLTTDDVQADRRGAVEQAVQQFGGVVLLKGARTLVASPDGTLYVNTTGNAGMATGGAGDTLTGMICALLAGKMGAPKAAACGAYLHGLAGDLAADAQGGKAGLIATDIADFVPRAIARCQQEAV